MPNAILKTVSYLFLSLWLMSNVNTILTGRSLVGLGWTGVDQGPHKAKNQSWYWVCQQGSELGSV